MLVGWLVLGERPYRPGVVLPFPLRKIVPLVQWT